MDQYNNVLRKFQNFNCKDILTSLSDFETVLKDYKSEYYVPCLVKLPCGCDKITSYYSYKIDRHDGCISCFKRKSYDEIVTSFNELGAQVLTTFQEFLTNNMTIGDKIKIKAKCGHERIVFHRDFKDLPENMRNCVACNRKLKNNGNWTYEQFVEKFQKLGCETLTTKTEFIDDKMNARSLFKVKGPCGHTFEKIPANIKNDVKRIKCPEC